MDSRHVPPKGWRVVICSRWYRDGERAPAATQAILNAEHRPCRPLSWAVYSSDYIAWLEHWEAMRADAVRAIEGGKRHYLMRLKAFIAKAEAEAEDLSTP